MSSKSTMRWAAAAMPPLLAAACQPVAPPPVIVPDPIRSGKGDEITDVRPAATGLRTPFDAVPSSDGSRLFFTAIGPNGPSIFRLDEEGGQPVELATGLNAPIGLVLSSDDETVFVADVAADQVEDGAGSGVILQVPASGGQLSALEATRGMRPRSLDMRVDGDHDVLVFSGNTSTADRRPGVFELSLAGGGATTLAGGAPFMDPSGIAVSSDGVVYVADSMASPSGKGAIIKVEDGVAQVLTGELSLGFPAGIALTSDEAVLLVSGLDPAGGGAQVYVVDIETAEYVTTNSGIEGNDEAGGLHRAKNADRYTWGGSSTVYILDARPAP